MVEEIRATKALTDKPFGVDLLTASGDLTPAGRDDHRRRRDSVFVAGLGVPRDVVDLCHKHGVLVVNMCGKVHHAILAVEAGCDIVVAQGTEAGGHTGQVATMPLVPQIVDAVDGRALVVAAGGIFDGRGLAAALCLGADGVWVGTRFIATPEAPSVHRLQGDARRAWARRHHGVAGVHRQDVPRRAQQLHRVLRAAQGRTADLPRPESVAPSATACSTWAAINQTEGVDPEREFFPAGQGVGAHHGTLIPAGDIVRSMVADAEEILAKPKTLIG